jgi:hypothetical protein
MFVKYTLLLSFVASLAFGQDLVTPVQPTVQPPVQPQEIVSEPQPALQPITAYQRLEWFTKFSIGPDTLLGGTLSAGWGTVFNQPHEYGTHWDGFGDRYGIYMSSVVTSNAMEASLGAIWQEDPRYSRAVAGSSFRNRVGHVVKWTVMAPGGDGALHPAYARCLAIAGSNFLSNTWREPSEADSEHALERTGLGFLGRMASNAWIEFWPDAKRKLFHHGRAN